MALKVQEIEIALSMIFLLTGLIMLGFSILLFNKLWKRDTLIGVIFFYLLFSFSLNYLFAFGYAIASGFNINSIIDSNGSNISGTWNFVYFSYSVFYNSVQGYIPNGYQKLIVIIHTAISYILHIIVLTCIIQRKLVCGQDRN